MTGKDQIDIEIGSIILAQLPEWAHAYRGSVKSVHENDRYHVIFDDGEEIEDVELENISYIVLKHDSNGWLDIGDHVGVRGVVKKEIVEADVQAVNSDASYVVILKGIPSNYTVKASDIVELYIPPSKSSNVVNHIGAAAESEKAEIPSQSSYDSIAPGTRILAKLESWDHPYCGIVQLSHGDGTFKVLFDDEEEVEHVNPPEILKILSAPEPVSIVNTINPKAGNRVSVRITGWKQSYDGTVDQVRDDQTFRVTFDDGEIVESVKASEIVAILESSTEATLSPAPIHYSAGMRISAKIKGWKQPYDGVIDTLHQDGSCRVTFDDGEVVESVKISEIISAKPMEAEEIPTRNVLPVHTRVSVKVQGWLQPYNGTICSINSDGTYRVTFDDGDVVKAVKPIEILAIVQPLAQETMVTPGIRVQVKINGWHQPYEGTVDKINSNGTLKVHFDDGEVVETVKQSEIVKILESVQTLPAVNQNFEIGKQAPVISMEMIPVDTRVSAQIIGWKQPYNGTIQQQNRDGSYQVVFDDGEVVESVQRAEIVKVLEETPVSTLELIPVDTRVSAQITGWKQPYCGTIKNQNGDGSYQVVFDDGELVESVQNHEILEILATSVPHLDALLPIETRVIVQLMHWKQPYNGTIRKHNPDGTYQIEFDDGEFVKSVTHDAIVNVTKAQQLAASALPIIQAQARVSAKIPSWDQAYNGIVESVNADGTYRIIFDDGEVVDSVAPHEVLDILQNDSSIITTGARVAAKIPGWQMPYEGVIVKQHEDGTYQIKFDDGEIVESVSKSCIVSILEHKAEVSNTIATDMNESLLSVIENAPTVASDKPPQRSLSKPVDKLSVGDVVLAKISGWDEPYRGTIARINMGTASYKVKFDDGEVVNKVAHDEIVDVLESAKILTKTFTAIDGKEFTDEKEFKNYMYDNFLSVKNISDASDPIVIPPGRIQNESFDITDVSNSTVALLCFTSQVQIDRVSGSEIFIGPCEASVFIRDCVECKFTVACRQLRLRNCSGCTFNLFSNTDPIIETSTDLIFRPFNGAYPGLRNQFGMAKLNPEDNHWREIFDFNAGGTDGYDVPDPHYALEEAPNGNLIDEWIVHFDELGPPENPVAPTAIATTLSDGGSTHRQAQNTIVQNEIYEWAKLVDSNHVAPGCRVRVNFNRSSKKPLHSDFYAGVIQSRNADGTYTIAYDDGDVEDNCDIEFIKVLLEEDSGDVVPSTAAEIPVEIPRVQQRKAKPTPLDEEILLTQEEEQILGLIRPSHPPLSPYRVGLKKMTFNGQEVASDSSLMKMENSKQEATAPADLVEKPKPSGESRKSKAINKKVKELEATTENVKRELEVMLKNQKAEQRRMHRERQEKLHQLKKAQKKAAKQRKTELYVENSEKLLGELESALKTQQKLQGDILKEHEAAMSALSAQIDDIQQPSQKQPDAGHATDQENKALSALKNKLETARAALLRDSRRAQENMSKEIEHSMQREMERGWDRQPAKLITSTKNIESRIERELDDIDRARKEMHEGKTRRVSRRAIPTSQSKPAKNVLLKQHARDFLSHMYEGYVSKRTGEFEREPKPLELMTAAWPQKMEKLQLEHLSFHSRVHDDVEWKKIGECLKCIDLGLEQDWYDWTVACHKTMGEISIGYPAAKRLGVVDDDEDPPAESYTLYGLTYTHRECSKKLMKSDLSALGSQAHAHYVLDPPLSSENRLRNALYKKLMVSAWQRLDAQKYSRKEALEILRVAAAEDEKKKSTEMNQRTKEQKIAATRSFEYWKSKKEEVQNELDTSYVDDDSEEARETKTNTNVDQDAVVEPTGELYSSIRRISKGSSGNQRPESRSASKSPPRKDFKTWEHAVATKEKAVRSLRTIDFVERCLFNNISSSRPFISAYGENTSWITIAECLVTLASTYQHCSTLQDEFVTWTVKSITQSLEQAILQPMVVRFTAAKKSSTCPDAAIIKLPDHTCRGDDLCPVGSILLFVAQQLVDKDAHYPSLSPENMMLHLERNSAMLGVVDTMAGRTNSLRTNQRYIRGGKSIMGWISSLPKHDKDSEGISCAAYLVPDLVAKLLFRCKTRDAKVLNLRKDKKILMDGVRAICIRTWNHIVTQPRWYYSKFSHEEEEYIQREISQCKRLFENEILRARVANRGDVIATNARALWDAIAQNPALATEAVTFVNPSFEPYHSPLVMEEGTIDASLQVGDYICIRDEEPLRSSTPGRFLAKNWVACNGFCVSRRSVSIYRSESLPFESAGDGAGIYDITLNDSYEYTSANNGTSEWIKLSLVSEALVLRINEDATFIMFHLPNLRKAGSLGVLEQWASEDRARRQANYNFLMADEKAEQLASNLEICRIAQKKISALISRSPRDIAELYFEKLGRLLSRVAVIVRYFIEDEETLQQESMDSMSWQNLWLKWLKTTTRWIEFEDLGFEVTDIETMVSRKWTKFSKKNGSYSTSVSACKALDVVIDQIEDLLA